MITNYLPDGTPLSQPRNTSNTSSTSKGLIKTPPRVALAQTRSAGEKDESRLFKTGSPKGRILDNETGPESHSGDAGVQLEMSKVERGQDLSSRDLQIPSIERDSGIMEAQFARELTSLGDRLTREAEKATFWEKKYSTLDQRYLKTDTDLRILQHDMAVRETQLEERDRDISTRISSLKIDRDAFREGYNSTQRRLEDKEQEVDELRNQVKGLKEFVSTNTRTEGQITDEAFADLMQNLGNGLQNWVISSFRKTKIGQLPVAFSICVSATFV